MQRLLTTSVHLDGQRFGCCAVVAGHVVDPDIWCVQADERGEAAASDDAVAWQRDGGLCRQLGLLQQHNGGVFALAESAQLGGFAAKSVDVPLDDAQLARWWSTTNRWSTARAARRRAGWRSGLPRRLSRAGWAHEGGYIVVGNDAEA